MEKPYYGYRINKYITAALGGGGLVGIALAIALEVCGATYMKLSEGFSRLTPSVLVLAFYGLCSVAFILALKHIDLSLAYAVWAGLGTALITAVGILWFKEPVSALKIISVG